MISKFCWTICILSLPLNIISVEETVPEIHENTILEKVSEDSNLNPTRYAGPVDDLYKALYRPLIPPEGPLLPKWLNVTRYNVGVKFAKKHFFSVFLLPIVAATLFISNPLGTPLLSSTRKSSTPSSSNKRYVATILHIKMWFETEIMQQDDYPPALNGSETKLKLLDDLINPFVLESLYNIRAVHFNLIRNYPWDKIKIDKENMYDRQNVSVTSDLWEDFRKDISQSNIPAKNRKYPEYFANLDIELNPPPILNQLTLALTQFLLGCLPIVIPERGGISGQGGTKEGLEGFLHMWAVYGYALGIEDEFNVALQPDLATARKYFQIMVNEYLHPSLFYLSENQDAQVLYEAFLKGFIKGNIGENGETYVKPEQLLLLAVEDVHGIPCPYVTKRLPFAHQLLRSVFLKRIVGWMEKYDVFREFINYIFNWRYCEGGARKEFDIDANNLEQVVAKSYA